MMDLIYLSVICVFCVGTVAFTAYQKGRKDGFCKDGLPIIEWYRCANRQLWDRLYAKGEM